MGYLCHSPHLSEFPGLVLLLLLGFVPTSRASLEVFVAVPQGALICGYNRKTYLSHCSVPQPDPNRERINR